jgi:thiamine-phosphate pyrophosphorylase
VLRYYITDRKSCPGEVTESIRRNVQNGVEYIQIREKDLTARELFSLTIHAVTIARGTATRILVNDRADVALAAGAHGVHLRSDSIEPAVLRQVLPKCFLIAVSCHTEDDLRRTEGADFAVFGPVFASPGKGPATGVEALGRAVVVSPVRVFALGGITWENAPLCLEAGAAGIAAIRLFQS